MASQGTVFLACPKIPNLHDHGQLSLKRSQPLLTSEQSTAELKAYHQVCRFKPTCKKLRLKAQLGVSIYLKDDEHCCLPLASCKDFLAGTQHLIVEGCSNQACIWEHPDITQGRNSDSGDATLRVESVDAVANLTSVGANETQRTASLWA